MNFEKLEELYGDIDRYEKLTNNLNTRMVQINSEKSKEESVQHLLKFELSQVLQKVEGCKEEVEKLEIERKHLSKTLNSLQMIHKHFSSHEVVNNMRLQMKNESLSLLQNKLDTLDFEIEQREYDPSRSATFSQFQWRQ